jgi:hypothetical protein
MSCLLMVEEREGIFYDMCLVGRIERVEVEGVYLETEFRGDGEECGHWGCY